jgi:hypothetical protein
MKTFTECPTDFEIYGDDKMLAAKVSMFDEGAATVEIKTALDRTSFDLLVPAIQRALSAMDLAGDRI